MSSAPAPQEIVGFEAFPSKSLVEQINQKNVKSCRSANKSSRRLCVGSAVRPGPVARSDVTFVQSPRCGICRGGGYTEPGGGNSEPSDYADYKKASQVLSQLPSVIARG